jgi:hypothetical protein
MVAGDASIPLPQVGQTGRLHVAGRSVPVEVEDHLGHALKLDVVEDGWTLTDGEARLTCTGDDATGLISGSVRVLADGMLVFTPGRLTRDVPAAGDAEEVIDRRGRGSTPDVGQHRETFRVDLLLDAVVLVDGRELPAQTLNVSPTGCLLRGDARPLVDTVVTVRLPVDDRRLQVQARVIRVEGDRYALHFREMDATQERALSRLIAKRQREILRRR